MGAADLMPKYSLCITNDKFYELFRTHNVVISQMFVLAPACSRGSYLESGIQ